MVTPEFVGLVIAMSMTGMLRAVGDGRFSIPDRFVTMHGPRLTVMA
jgi:hypothetical protein